MIVIAGNKSGIMRSSMMNGNLVAFLGEFEVRWSTTFN